MHTLRLRKPGFATRLHMCETVNENKEMEETEVQRLNRCVRVCVCLDVRHSARSSAQFMVESSIIDFLCVERAYINIYPA
jgi:hypothetical protein